MFHKEGHTIIVIFLTAVIGDILLLEYFLDDGFLKIFLQLLSLSILILILQFFRNPKRKTKLNQNHIISPVDGKVVNIQKVYEKEYFKDFVVGDMSAFMNYVSMLTILRTRNHRNALLMF